MKRRLRLAGTAFGALLVPACAGFQPEGLSRTPVSASPPPNPTGPTGPANPAPVGYRPMGGPPPAMAAKPKFVEKFAEGRSGMAPVAASASPVVIPPPAPIVSAPSTPATGIGSPAPIVAVEHKPVATPPATVEAPRLIHPALNDTPVVRPPEPTPDAQGVIRPNWPVIPGVSSNANPPTPAPVGSDVVLPPPSELMRGLVDSVGPVGPAKSDDVVAPIAKPPALPPGVIGSSVSHASPAGMTPAEQALSGEPVVPATGNALPSSSPATAADNALVRAVQAFQQNRPDEAVELLKTYDPATQQVLLSLMPALVRLSEGKLQSLKPEEMDILLDQLSRVPNMLRPRASLRAENVRLCREVHNFAHVEPFPERHPFRAGDIVYLYMELANFSCTPDPKGGYTIRLASSLELKDQSGAVVWRADPKESADQVSTPPQDYYRNFRLCVPAVPPGTYTLAVKTIDRPTGREVRKAIEVRVAAR
jgi:hypothetical protein